MARFRGNPSAPDEFNTILPRTINAEIDEELMDKKGVTTYTGGMGSTYNAAIFQGTFGNQSIYRNPARRFYDPETTTTAIYLPRNFKQKNRWNRWFYDHDEMIGAVLDLHSELPYSKAEILYDDKTIQYHVEECMDRTNFYTMLPLIDLEYMKIGEVFVHTIWDNAKGMWSHIVIHNPDFIEVKFSPFADQESVIELMPDEELRSLIHSTKPEEQQLKKRLPREVVRRVLTGKNIVLNPEEVTHVARRSNPYDERGTSIITRLHRLLMYEDKLRESQITIADNFVYPLKIFKLGDPQKGWIPNETHQRALAQMLQQANFDPNFSLIYHYGLQVEYMTVADKVMRLDKEWTEISEKKMIALGVSKQFVSGDSSYASANVGLQTQLARYKAKRDLFEFRWMRDKFFRIMAERNGWYRRDAREIMGHFRVKRKGSELQERLITPEIVWHKKLMMRDDQQYLTFLNNVYAQGKGPLSAITMLMGMGLDLQDELRKKHIQKKLEEQIGEYIHTPLPGPAPAPGLTAKIKDKLFGRQKESEASSELPVDTEFTGAQIKEPEKQADQKEVVAKEITQDYEIAKDLLLASDETWNINIKSPHIPREVVSLLTRLDTQLQSIKKKYGENFVDGITEERSALGKILTELYLQGKLTAYSYTNFLPIYREHYAVEGSLRDYSDLILSEEFEDWLFKFASLDKTAEDIKTKHIRELGATCYCFGQLKGFQEQGIYNVKIGNVERNDGLRYKVDELLSRGMNLSSIVSPNGEIAVFSACIEGFDDPDFGNNLDPRIVRTKNFSLAGIKVHNCPVEFVPFVERYLDKLGKFAKSKYDDIFFVKDVLDLDEWEVDQKKRFEQKYSDLPKKDREFLFSNYLNLEKLQKRGKLASIHSNRNLFISTWIGMEDVSLTKKLIDAIDVSGDALERSLNKVFKSAAQDLSTDEITTYRVFKYLEPVTDSSGAVVGWEASPKVASTDLPVKLRRNGKWDSSGKNIFSSENIPIQTYQNNVITWIDYPHKLSIDTLKCFEELRHG